MRKEHVTCPLSRTPPLQSLLRLFKRSTSNVTSNRPKIQRLLHSVHVTRPRAIAPPKAPRFKMHWLVNRPPSGLNCWPRQLTRSAEQHNQLAAMLDRRNFRWRKERLAKRQLRSRRRIFVARSPLESRQRTSGAPPSASRAVLRWLRRRQMRAMAIGPVDLAVRAATRQTAAAARVPAAAAVLGVVDLTPVVASLQSREQSSVLTSASTAVGRAITLGLISERAMAHQFVP